MVRGKSFKLCVFLVSLFLLFGFVQGVSAASFDVERENIKFRINPFTDEIAKFNLSITNYLDTEERYSLRLSLGDSLNWLAFPSNVRVPGGSTETFLFTLDPKSATPVGVYQINLRVVASSGEEKVIDVPVDLNIREETGFVPNVEITFSVPELVDPRERSVTLGVNLRNRNPLFIEDAELRIRSDLFSDSQVVSIPSGPHRTVRDAKSLELVYSVDPFQAPGEYDVVVELFYPPTGRVISSETQSLSVLDYSAIITERETETRLLFITEHTISAENRGNRRAIGEISLGASWIKNIFSITPADVSFESGPEGSFFLWTPVIEPTGFDEIVIVTNYWPLVIGILIILVAILAYFLLRSPIVLEKEVAVIDEDVGEGSSELRVRLFVKNRTGRSVSNLTVSDKVRGITDYVESTQLGHVKPSRTTKTSKKGTLLYWDVEELEAYEERIFTYKLRSKLKVVGNLTLPKAGAKFETKNKKERKILSDKPYFKKVKKKKVVE